MTPRRTGALLMLLASAPITLTAALTLHEQRLTYRDIDNAGVAITITITKEQA